MLIISSLLRWHAIKRGNPVLDLWGCLLQVELRRLRSDNTLTGICTTFVVVPPICIASAFFMSIGKILATKIRS